MILTDLADEESVFLDANILVKFGGRSFDSSIGPRAMPPAGEVTSKNALQ